MKTEIITSDGQQTIGYVNGKPAEWAGNTTTPKNGDYVVLKRENSTFHDGNELYRVIETQDNSLLWKNETTNHVYQIKD